MTKTRQFRTGWIKYFSPVILTTFLFFTVTDELFAAPADDSSENYDFCRYKARELVRKGTDSSKEVLTGSRPERGRAWCVRAEVKRRLGDYSAEDAYEKAIELDPDEAGYEILYAEYLRNFRGAGTPLFERAERHFLAAKVKFEQAGYLAESRIGQLTQRGLINLYQTDGASFPVRGQEIYQERSSRGNPAGSLTLERPVLFFSTINEFADRTTDPDEVDDSRNFTSEVLFAESAARLNRSLTKDELRRVLRKKEQFDTFNRLRYRPGKFVTAADVFFRYRHIDDAQITNFFEPNDFNDLELYEFGVALEKSFTVGKEYDAFVRGSYKRIDREGLIEFRPDHNEDINHFEVNAALSHFVGPDKLTLDATYVYQDIDPNISNFPDRDRQIVAGGISYLVARPSRLFPNIANYQDQRFQTRGLDLFAGFLFDRDSFGSVDIDKWDYFVGGSLKGFGPDNSLDLTIQPTIFTSSVDDDSNQDNAQYRTNVVLLYRIVDEERNPGIPEPVLGRLHPAFVHLTVPFRHDVDIDGPDSYENWAIGVDLSSKFFLNEKGFGATFLASAGYTFQRFYNLNESVHQFQVRLTMGF